MEDIQTEILSDKEKPSNNAKKFPALIIAGILLLALVGIKMVGTKEKPQLKAETPAVTQAPSPTETPAQTPISLAEISKHALATDCWFAVDGKVYDVTKFVASGKHGGGEAIVEGCGKDATVLFNTRPMGTGTPHSDKARGFMASFQIGLLN